jgi:hypothetical protein
MSARCLAGAPACPPNAGTLVAGRCATALEAEGYPHAAVRLRSASTHWLRHTHGTLTHQGRDIPGSRFAPLACAGERLFPCSGIL